MDLARGMAVLFMIMQHGMIIYGINEGAGSLLGEFIVILGTAPAAPVFMLIMGVFFPMQKDMKLNAVRGVKLIGTGYLLNLFRFVLPSLIGGEYSAGGPDSLLGQFLVVDILQMAGFSLIIMGLIRSLPPGVWAGFVLVVALVSPLLWQYAPQTPVFDLFWGTHHNVAFPLFPWVIYPVMGMVWGRLFRSTRDMDQFMKQTARWGAGFTVLGGTLWLLLDTSWMPRGEYHRFGLQGQLMILGFVFIWLGLFHFLAQHMAGSKLAGFLIFWSKNLTPVYVIQWLLVGWGMLVFGYQTLPPGGAALVGIGVTVLTHWVMKCFKHYKIFKKG